MKPPPAVPAKVVSVPPKVKIEALVPGQQQTIYTKDGRQVRLAHSKPKLDAETGASLSFVRLYAKGKRIGYVVLNILENGRVEVGMVEVEDKNFKRQGLTTKVYDRIAAWAAQEGLYFGPSDNLLDDGFAFWKARNPNHPRILSDARNYLTEIKAYALKEYGDGIEIKVEMNGRDDITLRRRVPRATGGYSWDRLEETTFEELVKKRVLPDVEPYTFSPR